MTSAVIVVVVVVAVALVLVSRRVVLSPLSRLAFLVIRQTERGRNRGVTARSGVVGQDRAVSISPRNMRIVRRRRRRSQNETRKSRRDIGRVVAITSHPRESILPDNLSLVSSLARHVYTSLRPPAPLPRHPSLCFHAILPLCTLPPRFLHSTLVPISVLHFLPPRLDAIRVVRSCAVLSPARVAASVWFALARVSVFTRACVCTPRARSYVAASEGLTAAGQERKRLVSR